ncbi:hypothetical protein [Halomonas dongshanensis]|uniref:Uncharacterized protein n=1 Tax=Halomonas dongshanensis TaxID=2890835 RepID=A0ABT2EB52_9GAMM|nr:hypothetical protein [Halomonas dongshanensis]MCS2608754.1 hypothetical protein [Halomonas dongshanensis]
MTSAPHTVTTRTMTPNERFYAEQMLTLRRWRMRSYALMGALLLLMTAAVIWLGWQHPYLLTSSTLVPFLLIMVLVLGIFGGIRIAKMGVGRKVVLGEKVHVLQGPFSVVTRNGGGQNASWREYFVGNVSLRTPLLTDLVAPKSTDQEIEVAAVYLETYPKKDKLFDKYQGTEALALYIEDQIDIDTLIEKRGRYYLVAHFIKTLLFMIFVLLAGAGLLVTTLSAEFITSMSSVAVLAVFIGDLIVTVVGGYLLMKLSRKVRQWLNPKERGITHAQRVRGL